jgi:hypothetical protein
VDLKRQYAAICDEVHDAIQNVLDQCAFASGPAVASFEAEFARYCGGSLRNTGRRAVGENESELSIDDIRALPDLISQSEWAGRQ